MNVTNNLKLITVLIALIGVSACKSTPPPIDIEDNTVLVPYEQVNGSITSVGPDSGDQSSTANTTGGKARWGGKIVSVTNKADVSEIEVVFFPENSAGKPRTGMPSAGRFKAVVDGFVDPLVFEKGRLITVVGEVAGSQSGLIGEQEYIYPTLSAMGYYMWKETTDVNVEVVDTFAFLPFGYRSSFHNNFFNPWYGSRYSNRQRGRVRIERYNGHSQGSNVTRNKSSNNARTETRRKATSTSGTRQTNVKTVVQK